MAGEGNLAPSIQSDGVNKQPENNSAATHKAFVGEYIDSLVSRDKSNAKGSLTNRETSGSNAMLAFAGDGAIRIKTAKTAALSEGSFKLEPKGVVPKRGPLGGPLVDKFDQLPVEEVKVGNGKVSLKLSRETAVKEPDDPNKPNRRNQEIRFGKKQADGSVSCSANIVTKTDSKGNINHITLDNPENLAVAGEEFIGKKVFGRVIGGWVSGDSPVNKVVLDNTNGSPQVHVSFKHPIDGHTTTIKPIPKEDFKQIASWITEARERAFSDDRKVADSRSNHNPNYARD